MEGGKHPVLEGPASIRIAVRSPRGPFAAAGPGGTLPIRPVTITITGTGGAALEARCSPLRDEDSGTTVSGALEIARSQARDDELILSVAGAAPQRAGRYAALLTVSGTDATLAVPVTVEVSASPAWGVALMMAGLATVALTTVLANESAVRERQAEVLAEQQALHERLERDPPPRRMQADIEAADREYALALASLSARTPLSFVDRRLADAAPHMAAASSLQAELAHATSGHAPGEAELADLEAAWALYTDLAGNLSKRVPAAPAAPAAPEEVTARDLPALMDAYQARFARRFLPTRIAYDRAQLEQVMLGVRLAAASGRSAEAHARAEAAQLWIQQGTDALQQARELIESNLLLGFNLVSNAIQVQRTMQEDHLPDDDAQPITGKLDEASRILAAAAGQGHGEDLAFQQANHLVNEAQTDLTRVRAAAALASFRAALAASAATTGLDDVNEAMAREQALPHKETPQKVAGIRRIMEVWRVKVSRVGDPKARAALAAQVAGITAALDAADLKAASARYRQLANGWAAWGTRTARQQAGAALKPWCARDKVLASVQLAQITESLRQMPPRPERNDWATRLDAERSAIEQYDPDDNPGQGTCSDAVLAITGRLSAISREMFDAALQTVRITPAARESARLQAGLGALPPAPHPIRLLASVPDTEWTIGREIRFVVSGTDREWPGAAPVTIDWADGTPPLHTTLDDVLHRSAIPHVFRRTPAGIVRVRVTSPTTPAALVGEGSLRVALKPSPIGTVRAAADAFLNARFALALLIAGTIYSWRFHSGRKIFGAQNFDYAEAFALGFVVNSAVADLPGQIAKIAGGG